MADNSQEIEQLEQIINGAVESITVDGTSTKISLKQARLRLNELHSTDDASKAAGLGRRRVRRINLGNSW